MPSYTEKEWNEYCETLREHMTVEEKAEFEEAQPERTNDNAKTR